MITLVFAPSLPEDIIKELRAHPMFVKIQGLIDEHTQVCQGLLSSQTKYTTLYDEENRKEEEYRNSPEGTLLRQLEHDLALAIKENNEVGDKRRMEFSLQSARAFLYGEPVQPPVYNDLTMNELRRELNFEKNKMKYALYPEGRAPSVDVLQEIQEQDRRQKQLWVQILELTESTESFVWVVRK